MSESIPATHSILCTKALANFVQQHYAIANVYKCILLARGINDSYLLRADGAQYVLRVYQHNWRCEADIAYELEALAHLNSHAVRVSTALQRKDGNRWATIATPEGTRFIALFHYAAGQPIRYSENPAGLAQAYGNAVAQVHLHSDSFCSEHARFKLDLAELIDRPLQRIQEHCSATPEYATYFTEFADRLATQISRNPTLEFGFCHGDFHGQNAHVDNDLAITFFDFDCCGKGWRAYDLASFFWQARSTKEHQQLCPDFLRAYLAVRPLAEQDISAIPFFVAIRHLWWIALNISIAPSHGLGWINTRFWERQLQFCRELDEECFSKSVTEIYALTAELAA